MPDNPVDPPVDSVIFTKQTDQVGDRTETLARDNPAVMPGVSDIVFHQRWHDHCDGGKQPQTDDQQDHPETDQILRPLRLLRPQQVCVGVTGQNSEDDNVDRHTDDHFAPVHSVG